MPCKCKNIVVFQKRVYFSNQGSAIKTIGDYLEMEIEVWNLDFEKVKK
jgi:hypothetical protein